MVRTRHSAEEEFEPGEFLTLESKRSGSAQPLRNKHHEGSDDSGVVQFRQKQAKKQEAPVMLRSTRRSSRPSYFEDFSDDAEFEALTGHETRKSRRGRRILRPEPETYCEEEEIQRASKRQRSSRNRSSQHIQWKTEQDEEENTDKQNLKTGEEEEEESNDDENAEFQDMYSRVKRKRISVKRDMYGIPVEEPSGSEDSSNSDDSIEGQDQNEVNENVQGEENENDENEEEEAPEPKSYFLREHKPRTQLYTAPVIEPKLRRTPNSMFNHDDTQDSPKRRRKTPKLTYLSPARRKIKKGNSRRHAAFHGGSSSTSSSSSDSSSDEERFQRRKAKSMMKSRARCLPMNFDPKDLSQSGVMRDRQKVGASLADIDPMALDKSVTFQSVGGLGKHIQALKEMIVFPLLYPEIFERFKISPPRGVLFYGPPGTGKTLVARALANECSSDDRRVSFYMRKGADCLSKWVGESERQLRLLFDQAYQTRPSIIFFDEIDGLAPVRSSRQDQIHSSIVSTLLALMDGLDSRGEIVVIGATNRIDSIDPALRRPGRFDREFLFPLPSVKARSQILKINTKEWNPKLSNRFVDEVAEKCIGYCGADMKALCTEAALLALRRRYPQIYTSREKLQIDVSAINVNAKDFHGGMQNIVPTSQRSVTSPARALSTRVAPLLAALFQSLLTTLDELFPSVLSQLNSLDAPVDAGAEGTGVGEGDTGSSLDLLPDDDEESQCIYEQKDRRKKRLMEQDSNKPFLSFSSYAYQSPSTHRPRLLLTGENDQGQTSHLAPAILHQLEQLPVHTLDLPALFAVSARTPEESCAQIFREARRTSPSVIYMPHVSHWWAVLSDTVRATLLTLIQDLDPATPLLLLATSEEPYTDMDEMLQDLFDKYSGEVVVMRNPNSEERREFFKDLLLSQATKPPLTKKVAAERILEVLPKAPPPEPRKLTDKELKVLFQQEEETLRELRLFLRDVLNKLGRDRKFGIFTKPVDVEDVPDYYEIIKKPMDLSTMMSKIDLHQYQCVRDFLDDIDQICCNALEYNPDRDAQSRVIRHRACALKDTAYAINRTELDPEFEKLCFDIAESRNRRGGTELKTVPQFYHTKPLNAGLTQTQIHARVSCRPALSQPLDPNVRVSKRLRGWTVEEVPALEIVEKTARVERSLARSPQKDNQETTPQVKIKCSLSSGKQNSIDNSHRPQESDHKTPRSATADSGSTSSNKKSSSKSRSVWGRSSYSRRRKRRRVLSETGGGDEASGTSENEEQGDEEEMEVLSDTEITISTTPHHATPQSDSHQVATSSKSASVTVCLSIDTNVHSSSKDSPRSPLQRSPRTDSQRSPRADGQFTPHAGPRSPQADSGQRSPRMVSSQKSPRPQSPQNSCVPEPKSPKSATSVCRLELELEAKATASGVEALVTVNVQDKESVAVGDGQPVVNGFDSGIGSSDSNGDSNDSTEQAKAAAALTAKTQQATAEGEAMETEVTEKNNPEVEDSGNDTTSKFRVTRARVQTQQQHQALLALEEKSEPLVVDRERLVKLLDNTVTLTDGYTVCKLEKLRSMYSQCIYNHRLSYNKSQLVEDLERKLRVFTASLIDQSRSGRAHANL